MLISSKALEKLDVFSYDRDTYKFIDFIIDSTGLFIKALVMRSQGLKSTREYVVPASIIEMIYEGDAIYLNRESEELDRYVVASEFPHLQSLRSLGFNLSSAIAPLEDERNQFLNESGLNCYFLNDYLRFKVDCADDKLGKTKDVLLHPVTMGVHYLVVEVGHSFSKKWAYVPAQLIENVNWGQRVSKLNVPKEAILSGPLLNPGTETSDELEQTLVREAPQTLWSNWFDPPHKDDWSHMDF